MILILPEPLSLLSKNGITCRHHGLVSVSTVYLAYPIYIIITQESRGNQKVPTTKF